MDLVFLYGPPSAGKHTVGTSLASRTGFGLFHNHLTVDVVRAIFPDDDPRRGPLLEILRLEAIGAAARAGRDLIFSLAYSGDVDDKWVGKVVDAVDQAGGRVDFVQLFAPPEILMARVTNSSRVALGKVAVQERLARALATRDHYATVKHANHMRLDTAVLSPEQCAVAIIEHFALRVVAQ